MFSINETYITELSIKKSKFISILTPFNDANKLKTLIDEYRQKYPGASHYTYAYKTFDSERFYDDKEVAMTAGLPIFEEIEKNNLINVICIVIRYYGGVKLGTGGLRKAYKESSKEVISKAALKKVTEANHIRIMFSYDNTSKVKSIIKDFNIINEEYDENCTIDFYSDLNFDLTNLESICDDVTTIKKAFILK